jgi:hypothetical protein
MYHRDPMEANEYPDRGDGQSIRESRHCDDCADLATMFFYDGEPHAWCQTHYLAYLKANTLQRLRERC